MKNSCVRKSISQTVVYSVVFVIFLLVAFSYLYVLVWSFISGIRTHEDVALRPMAFTGMGHFENFSYVFSEFRVAKHDYFGMLLNSLYFSLLGPFITNILTCMLAYVTSKYKFFGSTNKRKRGVI